MKMGLSKKEIASDENYTAVKKSPDKRRNRLVNKSSLTLMRPRDKVRPALKFVPHPIVPVIPEANLFSVDESTAPEEIQQPFEIAPVRIESENAADKIKIQSDSVTFKRPAKISQTIQIGILGLGDIDKIGEVFRGKNLPLWQFTAFDKVTGAAWLSFAHELEQSSLIAFVRYLSDNFNKTGKTTAQICIEFHFDMAIGRNLNREDYNAIREYCSQHFAAANICHDLPHDKSLLNEFHDTLIRKFYHSQKASTTGRLLDILHAYLLKYNFNDNNEAISDLPPYQLICQQEGGPFSREILSGKPIILDRNPGNGINYLSSLRLLAGSMIAFLSSAIAPRKKRLFIKSKLRSLRDINSANSLARQTVRPPETGYEYISLRDVAWKRPDENPVSPGKYSSKIRNRQEIINRALKLLAEKRPMAELKRDLPITEGEISMLQRNLMLNKEVRTS